MSQALSVLNAVDLPSHTDSLLITRIESGTPGKSMDSTAILQGRKTVEINHNGSTYRLQATRLGKLILTK